MTFPDIDSATLNEIVNYMYTGEIRINGENVELILVAAHYFKIEWILEKCGNGLKGTLNCSICWTLYKLADTYSLKGLIENCLDYMARYFEEFVLQKTYLEMTFDEFNSLISRCFVLTESTVYTAIIDWVKYKIDDRKIHLQNFLSHINLSNVGTTFALQYIKNVPIFKTDALLKDPLWSSVQEPLRREKYNLARKMLKLRPLIFMPHDTYCKMYTVPDFSFFYVPPRPQSVSRCCTVYAKKKIFVLGGILNNKPSQGANVFDPLTELWSSIDYMPTSRYKFGACVLNDIIYVCGGENYNNDKVDIYNLEICKWMSGQNACFRGYTKCVSLSNVMYCVGERTTTKFDPREGLWKKFSHVASSEDEFCLVSDNNWCFYKIGGKINQMYDIRINKWNMLPSLNLPRKSHGAIILEGQVCVFAGTDNTSKLATTVEFNDVKKNIWVTNESIEVECCDASSAVLYIP